MASRRERPPASPPFPNLLAAYSTLALLERVPPCADKLWAQVHVMEGRVLKASSLYLHRFGEIFDRLGLAEVARSEIDRHAAASGPPGSIYLRYHSVALFEHCAGVLKALAAILRDHLEVDSVFGPPEAPLSSESLLEQIRAHEPDLGELLASRRPAIQRIERLALEATRPGGAKFAPPEVAAAMPAGDPAELEVNDLGVGRGDGPRREWLPIGDLAAAVVADAMNLVDAVTLVLAERLRAGARVDLDVIIETG